VRQYKLQHAFVRMIECVTIMIETSLLQVYCAIEELLNHRLKKVIGILVFFYGPYLAIIRYNLAVSSKIWPEF
jgi:hypothetical protein